MSVDEGATVLRVHRSERADALVAPLADVLRPPPDDPFAVDVVAVPTAGVERWLAQRLSHHLGTGPDGEGGIAAHIRFDSPARFLDDVTHEALGTGRTDDDPWAGGRLTWHVLDVVDACAAEPWCAPLGRYLGVDGPGDDRRERRMQTAAHLARLFASYAAQRPGMLDAWVRGVADDGARPGLTRAVDPGGGRLLLRHRAGNGPGRLPEPHRGPVQRRLG